MAEKFLYKASRGTIYTALTEHLEKSQVCARWVPRQLTEHNRNLRRIFNAVSGIREWANRENSDEG